MPPSDAEAKAYGQPTWWMETGGGVSHKPLDDDWLSVPQKLRDWRNYVSGADGHINVAADSAGAYWAWSHAAMYADEAPNNKRTYHTVAGTRMTYYTSRGMGKVAATVNVGHPSTSYGSVNGITARFQAYSTCQVVLLDSPAFPTGKSGKTQPTPVDYTPRHP